PRAEPIDARDATPAPPMREIAITPQTQNAKSEEHAYFHDERKGGDRRSFKRRRQPGGRAGWALVCRLRGPRWPGAGRLSENGRIRPCRARRQEASACF